MRNNRKWIFRIGALAAVIALAACMMIIGRGHTIYFDNKAAEVGGQTYEPFYKVVVNVKGEKVATLSAKDRGMTDTMGQSFTMDLQITKEKGGDVQNVRVSLPVPYGLDGVVVNLPALMAGEPQETYLEEFVPLPSGTESTEDVEIPSEGFEMDMENMGDDF